MTQKQNPDSSKIVPISVAAAGDSDTIKKLLEEDFKLRQIIDEMANALAAQKELIQQLRDEIATLKGQKPKPKIPSSRLEGPKSKLDWRKRIGPHDNQRKTVLFSSLVKNLIDFDTPTLIRFSAISISGSVLQKRALEISRSVKPVIKHVKRVGKPGQPKGKLRKNKKTILQIHAKPEIHPQNIPEGAKFKGYSRYTMQDLVIKSHNTQYQLARWQLPNGSYLKGDLPKGVTGHYGPQLITHILHQYHSCRVTEHLLLEQLHAFGVLISAGQLNNIIIENKERFSEEVAELLPVAAKIEEQLQVDDTGGRHNGQNQYTTIIGNRWFSVFATTDSKSRINFLKLLQGGKEEYVINEDALDYLSQVNVPQYLPGYISLFLDKKFTIFAEWEQFLKECSVIQETEVRLLTEAALYASVIQNGIPQNLGVHSDDAGQFDVFVHSLCWVHEERHYRKLIMTTDEARADLKRVIDQIWTLYQALKKYKESPNKEAKEYIGNGFDNIFQQKTNSPTLDRQLAKTYRKKQELLRVLERPETPLHNNSSETCARAAKIKLKISGGTRSCSGQRVRDVFLSLKQTCLKLGINFMSFLWDRVSGQYSIPRLATVVCERALAIASGPPVLLFSLNPQRTILQADCQQFVG